MHDKELRQDIIDALDWDPSVESANIGVAVNKGVAILSGHVPNYAQKYAAQRIVKSVKGVSGIADELEVRYPGFVGQTDEDIAHRAIQVLDWDVVLPAGAVKVRVSKGWVTLEGQLDWDFQRRAAEANIRRLGGVLGVTNEITLKTRVQPQDVVRRIEAALKRDAELEARQIRVSAVDGKVTLDGTVHSWRERDAIERAVWSAPGVRSLSDNLHVG